jgi:hypothetical protein
VNLNDIRQSKYLKREDCGDGVLATISGLTQENVAKEGAEADIKTVMHFHELDKPMVLNSTNAQAVARITGITEDIDRAWVGAKVVIYDDPNVSFGGKITGGIRIRAPRLPKSAAPKGNPAIAPAKPAAPAQAETFYDGTPLPDDSRLPWEA